MKKNTYAELTDVEDLGTATLAKIKVLLKCDLNSQKKSIIS